MKKDRSSNFELLRILAMLLIISFHYVFKGGFVFEGFSSNKLIVNVFTMFGELGVNLFVLITGYFMVHSTFRWKKVVLLMLEVQFYHILSMVLLYRGNISLMLSSWDFMDFFPNLYGYYWFAVCYLLLYIFSPYLNRLITSLSKKEFQSFLLLCLILWCIIPTLWGMRLNETESMLYYNRFIWMVVIYLVGAYISIYQKEDKLFSYPAKTYLLLGTLMLPCITVLIYFMEKYLHVLSRFGLAQSIYFWRPNTIITFAWSVILFLGFSKLNIPKIKIINVLSSTTFGIYLLHDGRISNILWQEVFCNATHAASKYLLLHILASTMCIFIAGACLDLIRQALERLLVKLIECVQ